MHELSCQNAILDGEVCVLDRQGRTNFSALQDALGNGRSEQLVFFAFDLIHLNGHDLSGVPLAKRKEVLAKLVAPVIHETSPIQFSDHVTGKGPAFFDQASRLGLEGITSKKASSFYLPGRSKNWLKTKCVLSGDFLVIGYSETDAAGGLSALLVAEDGKDGLKYLGKVGTGFAAQSAKTLRDTLSDVAREEPLFSFETKEKLGRVTWVEPRYLAEVQYRALTGEGRLRAASFKGLREDQTAAAAQIDPVPNLVNDADLAAIWVTNPDRVMFGEGGPTKLDLVLYYARVGNWMLPELINRPVTLVRCPTGKLSDTFYQRHANEGMVEHVLQVDISSNKAQEREDYLFIKDAKGLFALSQFGVIEFHPWGCRVDKPERPDRLIFDLDPDETLEWRDVVDAAQQLRDELSELGLTAFVRTTGGKGLHLVVP
ncbi:MAG: DNA ligase D, partial [Proteobacteria bacterium]|nr:DNA ligase D [Pseudomonadota bacterium]